ncbi:hypothetical protein ACHAPU_009121 [Fusarium lateritium]
MDDGKSPIHHLTEQCVSIFKTLSEHSHFAGDDWLEDRAADFAWWSYSLKAQKTGRSSLDYRLRSRQDVQKIIANLLESLAATLDEYLQSGEDVPRTNSNIEAEPVGDFLHAGALNDGSNISDGAGSDSSWSEFSDEAQSTKGETVAGDHEEADEVGSRFYIRTYIRLLTRISNAIIKSGTNLRYLKADEYLKYHQDDEEYGQLRRHLQFVTIVGLYEQRLFEELYRQVYDGVIPRAVEVVVRSCITDSSRLTSLQRHFIELNVIRRNRILYELERSGKRPMRLETTRTKPVLDPTFFQSPSVQGDDDGILITHRTTKLPTPSEAPSQRTEYPKSMTATELGSQFVVPIVTPFDPLDARKASSTVTRITQTGHHQDYPPCPASKGSFQCPYCGQLLSEEYLAKSRWRGHVAQDLGPYSCIYDQCPNSDEFFATKDQWVQHITSRHTVDRWLCDECTFRGDSEEELILNTEQEWERHMNTCHLEQRSQLALLSSISKRKVPELAKCPLCVRPTGYVRPDNDEHIAQHLHSWALRALPWTFDAENQDSDSNAIAGSDNDLARMSDLSSLSESSVEGTSITTGVYRREIPAYLHDFDNDDDRALKAIELLPKPPVLPFLLRKTFLNKYDIDLDGHPVLNIPNHAALNHVTTTSVKDDVFGIATTTRYREKVGQFYSLRPTLIKNKYITTVVYSPARGTYSKAGSTEDAIVDIEQPLSKGSLLPFPQPEEDIPIVGESPEGEWKHNIQDDEHLSADFVVEAINIPNPNPDDNKAQAPPKVGLFKRIAQLGRRRSKKKEK